MSKNTQISELINYISVDGSGNVVFTTVPAAASNTDKFLVSDAGTLKFRTAAQLLSDIGAQASGSYQAALSGTGFVKISGSTISYDNSTYLTTSSASSTYLPLVGGILTGGLTGTTASFSSFITAQSTGGSGLRIYGSSGTNQWDIYLNSTNLRFSDNTGTGSVVFDRPLSGTSASFTGNLGLGATSSAYKLRILTDNTLDNGLYLSGGTGSTNHAIYIENKAGTAEYFAVRGDGQIRLNASGTGNVLINLTSALGGKLDVQGDNNSYAAIFKGGTTTGQSYGPYFRAGTNSSDIAFQVKDVTEANTYFRVRGDGLVGIGTGSPASGRKLTVAGGAQFTYTDNGGASFNIVPGTNGQDGCDFNLSYYTGTGYGPLTFTLGGGEKVRIASNGYLGLLNTDPQARLHIGAALSNSADATNGLILKQTSTNETTGIYLERSGERKGYAIYVGGSLDSLVFQRNNAGTKSDVLTLTRDGHVGINQQNPTGLGGPTLVVAGSGYPEVIVEKTGSNARKWGFTVGSDGSYLLRDYTSGANVFIVNTSAGATLSNSLTVSTDVTLNNGVLYISAGSGTNYSSRLSTVYNYPYIETYLDSYAGASYEGRLLFRTNSGNGAMSTKLTIANSGAATFSSSITAGGAISSPTVVGGIFYTETSSVSNVGTSFVDSGTVFGNATGVWLVSLTAFGDGNMYSAALYVVTTAAYSKTINLIGGPSSHFGNGSVVAELSTTDGISANLRVRRTTVGSATVYVKVMKTGS